MKLSPSTTLEQFLAMGATAVCFSPEYSEERSLWYDGLWWVSDGRGGECDYKTLPEALKALLETT